MRKSTPVIVLAIIIIIASVALVYFGQTDRESDQLHPVKGNLNVYFFDVGQGDCILIDYGEFECLIDAGPTGTYAAGIIAPYVDGALEHVVLTHPHADHYGGLASVFTVYDVENYWTNGEHTTGKVYNTTRTLISQEPNLVTHEDGGPMTVGAVTLESIDSRNIDTNNNSLVIRAIYVNSIFLFMGDVESEGEAVLIPKLCDVDVLKVAHHGSCTSTSIDLLQVVKPEIAVYSAAVNNEYEHPCVSTISKLESVGAKVYGTDLNGTIRISTNGTKITVKTEK